MHKNPSVQKRFVLYGLGGSGKTQVCLKFAQDYREKFWGIFWIDASSNESAEQGFLDIAHVCGIKADFRVVKRWLSNIRDPWLLIIENADNPLQDASEYFPVGDRGVILLTTRNPECEVHATVGSNGFGRMESEEAITLLLRASRAGDISHEASRNLARPIVETLGCLALAIAQAGAAIRQKLCSMEEYSSVYSRRRKQLLSRQPVQASTDYKYTVYTTWEVSVEAIARMSTEAAHNAIEILKLFSFFHFDGVSEEILKEAWLNMRGSEHSEWTLSHQLDMLRQDDSQVRDPYSTREAVFLLSSCRHRWDERP
ncbi:MAG: hypothetical protein M1813_000833 [Trichoglossum hirsutum]|nr:MAG: hypothetical protein M1813_000833 [Trichoglossum hirsutum]